MPTLSKARAYAIKRISDAAGVPQFTRGPIRRWHRVTFKYWHGANKNEEKKLHPWSVSQFACLQAYKTFLYTGGEHNRHTPQYFPYSVMQAQSSSIFSLSYSHSLGMKLKVFFVMTLWTANNIQHRWQMGEFESVALVEWQGRWKTQNILRKMCTRAIAVTVNLRWDGLRSNPVRRGEGPATNLLTHDTTTKGREGGRKEGKQASR